MTCASSDASIPHEGEKRVNQPASVWIAAPWAVESGPDTRPQEARVFDGFELTHRDGLDGVRLRVRHGGDGPAVLLLHGHPRTHATWHRVAPLLAAAGHTVVCPDLRGYGRSDKPPTDPEHRPYSKRAMAGDCLAVMRGLGHERFAVVGHDRGAYVATRLALDHPEAVSALSVLDAIPIGEALRRCDAGFAASWWHWFFLGQTAKPAERGPGRLVHGHRRADGRRGLRGLPPRHPRPGHRARHVRGLPGRARRRPAARRRGPAGGPAHRLPPPDPVGHPRRHDRALRRRPGRLARLGRRPTGRRPDRLRPPHGRGGPGGLGRGAERVLEGRRDHRGVRTHRPPGRPGVTTSEPERATAPPATRRATRAATRRARHAAPTEPSVTEPSVTRQPGAR
ncbi:alpha/beta fold hydrolase [Streptomyces shaanxiensis]